MHNIPKALTEGLASLNAGDLRQGRIPFDHPAPLIHQCDAVSRPLDHAAQLALTLAQSFFRLLALSDVQHDPLPEARFARLVSDHNCLIV